MSRIGIFSGTFDPVHAGHISFALQVLEVAGLDKIMFLPERKPRGKVGITHYAHRAAMLRAALRAHPRLQVLELPDRQFTIAKSFPRLAKLYHGDELFLLLGSDAVYSLNADRWPLLDRLLDRCGLIVGIRGSDQEATIKERLYALPLQPPETHIILSQAPHVSSRSIREALLKGHSVEGLLQSVKNYSRQHWLYQKIRT